MSKTQHAELERDTVAQFQDELNQIETRITAHLTREFNRKYETVKAQEQFYLSAANAAERTCRSLLSEHRKSVDEFQTKQEELEKTFKTLKERYNRRLNTYENKQAQFETLIHEFLAKKNKSIFSWSKKPSTSTASTASDLSALLSALTAQP